MKWTRLVLWIVGALLLLLLILPVAASRTPVGAVLTCLPFGWWHFLKRNIPQLSYNWGLLSTGLICSLLVLALGNRFLRGLYERGQARSQPGISIGKWRWSWTVSLYAANWILFAIAFGAAGVWRHSTWLLNYNRPWYEERLNSYTELRIAECAIEQLLLENNQDLERTRTAVRTERGSRRGRNLLCEDFNIILYGDSSNKVAAFLIIPRDPKLLAKGNFAASLPEGKELIKPLPQLQSTLSEMDARYSVTTRQ